MQYPRGTRYSQGTHWVLTGHSALLSGTPTVLCFRRVLMRQWALPRYYCTGYSAPRCYPGGVRRGGGGGGGGRRTGAFAQRLCASSSAAGRVRVQVDKRCCSVEVAPARKVRETRIATVRLPDEPRRDSTRHLRRDLGARQAGVGVGRAENVVDCTRMRNQACTNTP
jgi:hypothetical protein